MAPKNISSNSLFLHNFAKRMTQRLCFFRLFFRPGSCRPTLPKNSFLGVPPVPRCSPTGTCPAALSRGIVFNPPKSSTISTQFDQNPSPKKPYFSEFDPKIAKRPPFLALFFQENPIRLFSLSLPACPFSPPPAQNPQKTQKYAVKCSSLWRFSLYFLPVLFSPALFLIVSASRARPFSAIFSRPLNRCGCPSPRPGWSGTIPPAGRRPAPAPPAAASPAKRAPCSRPPGWSAYPPGWAGAVRSALSCR